MTNIFKIMLLVIFLVVGVVSLTNFDNESKAKQPAKPESTPNISVNPSQAVGQPTDKPVTIITLTLVPPPHRRTPSAVTPTPFPIGEFVRTIAVPNYRRIPNVTVDSN